MIRTLTDLVKSTNIQITFRTNHTMYGTFKTRTKTPLLDVAETSNNYNAKPVIRRLRNKEHIRYITSNNLQSSYALHIPDTNTNMDPRKSRCSYGIQLKMSMKEFSRKLLLSGFPTT
jgi:hypothetical protein